MKKICILFILAIYFIQVHAQTQPRARDLGIPFDGKPGKLNAITDVQDVLVGYKTLISGEGKFVLGKGPVRTGVTVIFPHGKTLEAVPTAYFTFNGDGEMTGTESMDDYGFSYGALGITNTNSVGIVRDAIGAWNVKHFFESPYDFSFGLPIAAETWDGYLNDINGLHVTQQDVFDALDSAKSGMIEEGNVGGGTGMCLFKFKGGSGTSSRVITIDSNTYTVGVFVQANFGTRNELTVRGVPVGKEIQDLMPVVNGEKDGSIIVVIATDAPLLSSQLKLVAKHASLALGRVGSISHNSSGDIFLAFSTQAPVRNATGSLQTWTTISKEYLDPIYQATVDATEEAILNVLIAAKTMTGINGNIYYAIPHDRLIEIMKKYNRYGENK
jgi:L-aminopeptidase/D-esterase-like protein